MLSNSWEKSSSILGTEKHSIGQQAKPHVPLGSLAALTHTDQNTWLIGASQSGREKQHSTIS